MDVCARERERKTVCTREKERESEKERKRGKERENKNTRRKERTRDMRERVIGSLLNGIRRPVCSLVHAHSTETTISSESLDICVREPIMDPVDLVLGLHVPRFEGRVRFEVGLEALT